MDDEDNSNGSKQKKQEDEQNQDDNSNGEEDEFNPTLAAMETEIKPKVLNTISACVLIIIAVYVAASQNY